MRKFTIAVRHELKMTEHLQSFNVLSPYSTADNEF